MGTERTNPSVDAAWADKLWRRFLWGSDSALARAVRGVLDFDGLALIAAPDGRVLAASPGWDDVGIPAAALTAEGWRAWLVEFVVGDEERVRTHWTSHGNDGVITRYRTVAGGSVLIRWTVASWTHEDNWALRLGEAHPDTEAGGG